MQHQPNQATLPSRIFLIGYMGSGKTTLGKKLASRLGYQFIDLDHLFEEQQGMTIAQYFSQYGEEAFRHSESALLKEARYPHKTIISTGGGLPCFFDNMDWMNANGYTVYIKLNAKVLAGRLEGSKEERPLLRDKQGEALIAFIDEKLAGREPFYSQAQLVVSDMNLSAEKLEQLMIEHLFDNI
jgi:shikimate kinase